MRWLLLPCLVLTFCRPSSAIVNSCDVCGKRPLVPKHGGGMQTVGGVDALPGAWPWVVSLQLPAPTGHKHSCEGSLVTAQWVLTAAHCFGNKRNLPHWRAVIGASNLSALGSEVHVRFAKQVVLHEQYQPGLAANDIALLELDQPVKCSKYIQPACVPDGSVRLLDLSNCYISGWSITKEHFTNPSDVLQESKVNRFSVEVCNSSSWYNGSIQTHNLCAGYEEGGIDTCQGDSGSPLMCKDEDSPPFWVIGLTSWGQGCAKPRKPGVYTSTQYFYNWIKQWAGPLPQPPPTPRPPPAPRPQPRPVQSHLTTEYVTTQTTPHPISWLHFLLHTTTEISSSTQGPTQAQGITTPESEVPTQTAESTTLKTEAPTEITEITTLKTETPTQTTEITTLKTEAPTQTTEITTPKTEVPTQTTEITTLQTEAPTQTTEITTLQTEAPTQTTEITTLKTEAPTQTTEITTLKTEAPTQTTEITTLKTEVPTQTTEITTHKTEAPTQTTEITTLQTEAPTQTTEITTLKTEAPTQTTEITTLKTEAPTQTTEITTHKTEAPTQTTEITTHKTEAPTQTTEITTHKIEAPTHTAESTTLNTEAPTHTESTTLQTEAPTHTAESTTLQIEAPIQTTEASTPKTEAPTQMEGSTSSEAEVPIQTETEESTTPKPEGPAQSETEGQQPKPLPTAEGNVEPVCSPEPPPKHEGPPQTTQPPVSELEPMSEPTRTQAHQNTTTSTSPPEHNPTTTPKPKGHPKPSCHQTAELLTPPTPEGSHQPRPEPQPPGKQPVPLLSNDTVTTFFKMLQKLLQASRKGKGQEGPKLTEGELLAKENGLSLSGFEQPPATSLPVKQGSPCPGKGHSDLPPATRCPGGADRT